MEQLLLHLIGDYITQTDWMAREKTKNFIAAVVHAIVYSIPFLLLNPSKIAFILIMLSHYYIDHFRLARFIVFAKNKVTDWSLQWSDANVTGYHKDTPPWLAFWLLIIADNTMHLCINYSALRWL